MPTPDSQTPDQTTIDLVRTLIDDTEALISDDLISAALVDTAWVSYSCNPTVTTPITNYDKWAAAAQCLTILAAKLRKQFDFFSGEQRFYLKQKREACLELAAEYRKMAHLGTIEITRTDTYY